MIVKKISYPDIPSIRKLQPEGWPDIVPDFKFYIKNSYCNPIKIIQDDNIVGIGSGILFKDTGWLGHIIVDEGYRNRSIASYIVEYLCEHLSREGACTISLIATDSGSRVYGKLGFSKEAEYVFLSTDRKVDFNVSSNIRELDNYDGVLSLDRKFSGEDRSILLKSNIKDHMFIRIKVKYWVTT